MSETYLSVCDGIGGACEAFRDLDWTPALLSEIEPWPRALLEQRQNAADLARGRTDGAVPLWGDFSALRIRHLRRFGVALPSLLIGGTPCQSFSIAGLRRSLNDARGNLTLSFVKLANALDNARSVRGLPPVAIVWENVPGVLSTNDNAFGCFLGALVGSDTPLVPGRGQRWTDAGVVAGPRRKAAWRILDAQFFGLAQRRRRVFVVASAREDFDPAEILLERDRLPGNPRARGEAGQGIADPAAPGADGVGGEGGGLDVAGTLSSRASAGGGLGTDFDLAGGLQPVYLGNAEGGGLPLPFLTTSSLGKTVNNQTPLISDLNPGGGDVEAAPLAPTLSANGRAAGSATQQDVENGALVSVYPINADALRGEGTAKTPSPDAEGRVRLRDPGLGVGDDTDPAGTLAAAGPGAVAIAFQTRGSNLDIDGEVTGTIGSNCDRASGSAPMIAYNLSPGSGPNGGTSAVETDTAHCLTAGGEADKNGRGLHVVAFKPSHYTRGKDGAPREVYPALSADADKGDQDPVILAFTSKDHGQDAGEVSPTLRAMPGDHANGGGQVAIAFALRGRDDGAVPEVEGEGDTVGTLRAAEGGSSRDYLAMAVMENQRAELRLSDATNVTNVTNAITRGGGKPGQGYPAALVASAVRRLTPVECERLQGYTDSYTMIVWKGKPPEECPDGPRYRALGNSWAVPCVRWIGERIVAESDRVGLAARHPGDLWGRAGRVTYRRPQ